MCIKLIFFLLLLSSPVWAQVEIDMDAIAQIESSNQMRAYNKKTQARGLYQITPIVFKDFKEAGARGDFPKHANWIYQLTPDDSYNPHTNKIIAQWYLTEAIPFYLDNYNIPDTLTHRIFCYCWGIGNVVKWYRAGGEYDRLPKEVKAYLKKYKELTK